MFKFIKQVVERFPLLAFMYRVTRDERQRQLQIAKPTPYGFNLVGNAAMQAGTFEPEETDLIRHLLNDADVLVDVGANIGFYTCLARSMGKRAIAFEPLSQNLDYLYANLSKNGWEDTEVFPLGLSDAPGILTLYGGNTGASFVDGWGGAPSFMKRTISVSAMDSLLGDRFSGSRLLIKIDVEGAEYNVLGGAKSILSMSPSPIWLVEICFAENRLTGINPHYVDVFKYFFQHGYIAHTANNEKKIISMSDVEKWVNQGVCESGTHNYVFTRKTV